MPDDEITQFTMDWALLDDRSWYLAILVVAVLCMAPTAWLLRRKADQDWRSTIVGGIGIPLGLAILAAFLGPMMWEEDDSADNTVRAVRAVEAATGGHVVKDKVQSRGGNTYGFTVPEHGISDPFTLERDGRSRRCILRTHGRQGDGRLGVTLLCDPWQGA